MGRSIGRRVGALLGFGLLLAACGGSSKTPNQSQNTESVCDAGAARCVGMNVKLCSADGSKETVEQTCLPTQSCSDGACVENSCVPNTKFCKGSEVWKCDSTGGGSTLSRTCDGGQFCREDDGSAICSDQACTPGSALCDGNTTTICKADGSGTLPGGADCSACKQACYQGVCRDIACSSGTKVCQQGDVYLCTANGTDVALLADCQDMQACDGDQGICRPKLCQPGALSCDTTRLVKCNMYGTGMEPGVTDCAADGKVCVSGSCQKQTCTPNTSFCQDGNVWACDGNGTSSTLSATCDPQGSHCSTYGGNNYAYCESNQCYVGQVSCNGNQIQTCSEDGTWPFSGTDCGDANYCEDAVCKPKVCEPFTTFCKDGDIYYCDSFGGPVQGQGPAQECVTDTTCKLYQNNATCVPLPCSPGSTACIDNQVGVCATDGSSLSQVTDDCAAAASICGLDGKCAKSVSETIGVNEDAETDYGGSVLGDVIDVTSTRRVTELQMPMVLASPRELRWVIYEQSGANFVARIDQVVPNQSGGDATYSSGPISYTLKAGKRYLLAVAVSGGNAITYVDAAPFAPSVSFGNLIGRASSNYTSIIDAGATYSEYLYRMKVTTALP